MMKMVLFGKRSRVQWRERRGWEGGRTLIGVCQPVTQSGPDVDTNPGLSPPKERGARGAECSTPRRPPTTRLTFRRCAMDTTSANVAGLDVHHKTIQCAVRQTATGKLLT